MKKRMFLISSSRCSKAGAGIWTHCLEGLRKFLGPAKKGKKKVLFIPFANADQAYKSYTKTMSEPFEKLGYILVDIYAYENFADAFSDSSVIAVCVGGGNTWLLNYFLHYYKLFHRIRGKVKSGEWVYISASAGTVVAGLSMITTNDMCPIANPADPKAFGLVPFLINPHFVPGSLLPGDMGETREERIRQVLLWNRNYQIAAIPEGCWIECEKGRYVLCGEGEAGIFRADGNNSIWLPGEPFNTTGMF